MVGENYIKIDKMAVLPGLIVYGVDAVDGDLVDNQYAFSQGIVQDGEKFKRIDDLLAGKPGIAEKTLKAVLRQTGKKVKGAYLKEGVIGLQFSDGNELEVEGRLGLLAALTEGADLYVQRESLHYVEEMPEQLQRPIVEMETRGKFDGVPPKPVELSGHELKALNGARYNQVEFGGANTGIIDGKNNKKAEWPGKVTRPTGVMIEIEYGRDDDRKIARIGHTADDGMEGYGIGDLLRAAYVLADTDTKIKVNLDQQKKIDRVHEEGSRIATEIYLGSYLVELETNPSMPDRKTGGQLAADIMERTVVAQRVGIDKDIYAHFKEMGPMADTASFEAKLLLDWLDSTEGRIKTIYLGLAEFVTEPEPAINQKRKSEFDRSPGEKAFVVE